MDMVKKIKAALGYAEMSLTDLAKALGMSPQALNQRLKTGKFSDEDLERIAAAIGVTIDLTIKFKDGTTI